MATAFTHHITSCPHIMKKKFKDTKKQHHNLKIADQASEPEMAGVLDSLPVREFETLINI
jgi:hypothetical protein